MSGLRILITNKSFVIRGGAELYVRDLVEGLIERGHSPIVFSTEHGVVSREIRTLAVPVIEDLNQIASPPDIIHGQDHVQMMAAMAHFPRVPGIFFCHGWIAWEAMAPKFPRIRRYIAVDRICRDRMIYENGIPPELIHLVLSFVDLRRFKPRPPLPPKPQRALIFNNYATEENSIAGIREACNRAGIELDVLGAKAGNLITNPETVLGNYDIVFAKGRSALESLAVGTTVVPCDKGRMGRMVWSGELDRFRELNFAWTCFREPVTVAAVEREIARYDPEDAKKVTEAIRATAGRDAVFDQIVRHYEEVIAEHEKVPNEPDAELRATAAYLTWLTPAFRDVYTMENRAALAELARDQKGAQVQQLEALADQKTQEVQRLEAALVECNQRTEALLAENNLLTQTQQQYISQIDSLTTTTAETEAALLSTQAELEHMRNTLGWRILSYYGRFKQRFLLRSNKSVVAEPFKLRTNRNEPR